MIYSVVFPVLNEDQTTSYKVYSNDYAGYSSQAEQKNKLVNLLPDGKIFDMVYDVIAGEKPETANDPQNKTFGVVLTVNKFNQLTNTVVKQMDLEFD